MCSECGKVKSELRLSERMYECEACGMALDRDLNAARNLEQLVLQQVQDVSILAVRRKWPGATRKTPVESM